MSDPESDAKIGAGMASCELTGRDRQLEAIKPYQFQPGNGGRPKGAKNKFVEDFWKDLQKVWAEEGLDALYKVCRTMPDKFIMAAAGKIPSEVEHTSNTYVIVAPEASTSTQEWLDSLSVRRPDQTIQ
jgi:hypothetical protein